MKLLSSRWSIPLTVCCVALLAAGCGVGDIGGGPPSIKDATSCLKDLKLDVQDAPGDDSDVKEGVFASTDVTAGDADDLTIALAAVARNGDAVKEFERESTEFSKQLSKSDKQSVEIESGTDGNYVWVVMGNKDNETFSKAKDCVGG